MTKRARLKEEMLGLEIAYDLVATREAAERITAITSGKANDEDVQHRLASMARAKGIIQGYQDKLEKDNPTVTGLRQLYGSISY